MESIWESLLESIWESLLESILESIIIWENRVKHSKNTRSGLKFASLVYILIMWTVSALFDWLIHSIIDPVSSNRSTLRVCSHLSKSRCDWFIHSAYSLRFLRNKWPRKTSRFTARSKRSANCPRVYCPKMTWSRNDGLWRRRILLWLG